MVRAGATSFIQGKGVAWGEVFLLSVSLEGSGVDNVSVILFLLAVFGRWWYINGGRNCWLTDSGESWDINSDQIHDVGSRSLGGGVAGSRVT